MNLPKIHNVSFNTYNTQWVTVFKSLDKFQELQNTPKYHHLGLEYIGIDSSRTNPCHMFQITNPKKWMFARLKYNL